jgi:hypothetical protein
MPPVRSKPADTYFLDSNERFVNSSVDLPWPSFADHGNQRAPRAPTPILQNPDIYMKLSCGTFRECRLNILYSLQVSIFEKRGVLQSVTECTIHADMRGPNQCKR